MAPKAQTIFAVGVIAFASTFFLGIRIAPYLDEPSADLKAKIEVIIDDREEHDEPTPPTPPIEELIPLPTPPTPPPSPPLISTQQAESRVIPELPGKVLIPRPPLPLPPKYPPQPPQPVGSMDLEECLEYIKTRKWEPMCQARSQQIACTPNPNPEYITLASNDPQTWHTEAHSFSLTWESGHVKVVIKALKKACTEGQASKDDKTQQLLQQTFGPNSYRVKLDGPESLVVRLQHQGGCTYSGSVKVTVSGWYTLFATTLFLQYEAVSELHKGTGVVYDMSSLVGKHRLRLQLRVEPELVVPHPWEAQPPCGLDLLTASGRWLRPTTQDRLELDAIPIWQYPHVPGKNLVPFEQWGSGGLWAPYSCGWKPYDQDQSLKCLTNTQILFLGDSQTRSFFYPFLNKLYENKTVGNPKITIKDGPLTKLVKKYNIKLTYQADPYLDLEEGWQTVMRSTNWDVVVAGIGNWPGSASVQAQGDGLWTYKRYTNQIDKIAEDLKVFLKKTQTRFIFHLIPAFGFADFDPWRNNRRFELYNKYAEGVMKLAGAEIFDLYSVSLANTHAAFDGGHYTTFVSEHWAELLASYLCSRNVDKRAAKKRNP